MILVFFFRPWWPLFHFSSIYVPPPPFCLSIRLHSRYITHSSNDFGNISELSTRAPLVFLSFPSSYRISFLPTTPTQIAVYTCLAAQGESQAHDHYASFLPLHVCIYRERGWMGTSLIDSYSTFILNFLPPPPSTLFAFMLPWKGDPPCGIVNSSFCFFFLPSGNAGICMDEMFYFLYRFILECPSWNSYLPFTTRFMSAIGFGDCDIVRSGA